LIGGGWLRAETTSRDSLFSVTPEQMIFASKLSDSSRKLFCHKFSMLQRQQALDNWRQRQSLLENEEIYSPDDAVNYIVDQNDPKHLDLFLEGPAAR
ncbi:MAG: hypothetical protein EBZ47_06240, partial [Chlamydiae bacterium]|nr:hypothetical protein [Chlamydiota bacterium]